MSEERRDASPLGVIEAIDSAKDRATTKALDISLNELAQMYREGELEVRPEYQRLFRWSVEKQSQFIESLILEMPIPPIFVIELVEGKWELIDGLQRISSYLHFRGQLSAPEFDPAIRPGDFLELDGCDIIEELNGKKFDDLPAPLKIRLKRAFLRVEVVRKETDPRFRYYMFKRLNTGGETLSEQEIRNCTIRLLGPEFNNFIEAMAEDTDFKSCIESLSEEKVRKMGDVELVLRFFAFKNAFSDFKHDVADFMTRYMERVTDAADPAHLPFDYDAEKREFQKVFQVLNKVLGPNTPLKMNRQRNAFVGAFLVHHYEAFTLGLAKVASELDPSDENQLAKIRTALRDVKATYEFEALTTGGGKNSPGPYRQKIEFVEKAVREALAAH